ncbi:MAG: tRNA lysidine(34) synthetase TilS [Rhizobiaceae bacterium]
MPSGGTSLAERLPAARARQPVSAEFPYDHCFARLDLSGRKSAVVAVSGGSDSTALLHLFADFARREHPSLKIIAVTVDHGLRPEAADEARQVGKTAGCIGVGHVVKHWEGCKPETGLMEAAREARHRLLAEAAWEAGTDLVVVAHTLQDQAETAAMRAKRGAGRGDAGIAEATLYNWNTWFARPLLGIPRAALRQALSEAGLSWVDDPSNMDARYERVRVRAALEDDAVERLNAEARRAGLERQALGRRAAAMIDRCASAPARGLIRLEPALAADEDRDAAVYALRILLAQAGGQAHLPDHERAAALFDRLADQNRRATLSRAVVDRRKAGIFLYREKRNLPALDADGIWDGRFRIAGLGETGMSVASAGIATITGLCGEAPDSVPASLARASAGSLPGLWANGECLGLATGTRGITCEPVVAPWARYLPAFDLAPASAMARMIGAAEPPASPFAGHKEPKA